MVSNDDNASKSVKKPEERDAINMARELAEAGKTEEYILGIWKGNHDGDEPLGKALLSSLGCQSVLNSSGIHVAAIGEGGYGKSDGINQMGRLVHPDYWKSGGFTPQTLYYSGPDMPDGVVIGLDDVDWNSELGLSVKRITTEFQEGGKRFTTKEMQGVEVRTAKRIAFWTSCVDFQTDEQLGDRFLKYNVEASHERRKKIIGHMQTLDECAKKPDDDRFEKLVCQTLTYDLKMKTFPVKIPFSKKIKFDGDPRAYGIFRDMIKSSAVFRYQIREQDNVGILIATKEDFENARSLYVELGGHDRNKYSTAELKVLDAIIAKGDKEATQADIQEKANLSAGRVGDILNGRGKSELGLLHKCKGIIVNNDRRPIKYKLRAGFDPRYYVSIELEGGST